MLYSTYNEILVSSTRTSLRETRDCAVIAVAAVCNVEYGVSHATLKKNGRKNRTGTYFNTIRDSVTELGFNIELINTGAKTVSTIADYLPRNGNFLVRVSGHILAVSDGKVLDWTAGRRHRVQNVYAITPKNAPATPVVRPVVTPVVTPTPAPKKLIKQPKPGTLCRQVWDACDRFVIKYNEKPTASDMRQLAATFGWNVNNALAEMYQWKKFNAQ